MKKYLFVLPLVAILALSGISLAHAQVFTQNLYFGMQGNPQVIQLQDFLTSQSLYSGPINGNFYFLTLNAVKAFQTAQGISPAVGYFGPLTMAKANSLAQSDVTASNNEALSETGSVPSATPSSSMQSQLSMLMQEVASLETQLQAQQSSTQAIQNTQTQVLQQIASNTQSMAAATPVGQNNEVLGSDAPSSPSIPLTIVDPQNVTITSSSLIFDAECNEKKSVQCDSASVTINSSTYPFTFGLPGAENGGVADVNIASAGLVSGTEYTYTITASYEGHTASALCVLTLP